MQNIISLVLGVIGGVIANLLTPYVIRIPALISKGRGHFSLFAVNYQIRITELYSDPVYVRSRIRRESREAILFWFLSIGFIHLHYHFGSSAHLLLNLSAVCFGYGVTGLYTIVRFLDLHYDQKLILERLSKRRDDLQNAKN